MKRSFLSRSRSHKHPRYHRSSSRRMTRRQPHPRQRRQRRVTRRHLKKGGAIGETVTMVEGIPMGRNVVVTNSKGATRSLEEYRMMLNADTARDFGDDI